MRTWLVFVVVAAVVAVAAVQIVDFATRRNRTVDREIAELRASIESLSDQVREVRRMLEATRVGVPAPLTGRSSLGTPAETRHEGGEGPQDEDKTVVSVHGDGTYTIGGTPCSADDLGEALDALAEAHPGGDVVVVASDASYDAVVALMKECEQRGLKIAGAVSSGGLGRDEEAGPTKVNLEPVDVLLEIDAARKCTLDGREVALDALKAELKALLKANPAMRLVVRADESVPTSEVRKLLAIASEAGIYRVEAGTAGGDETPDDSE